MSDDTRERIVREMQEAMAAPPDPEGEAAELERLIEEGDAMRKAAADRQRATWAGFGERLREQQEQAREEMERSMAAIDAARAKRERRDNRRWRLTTTVAVVGTASAIGLGLWNRFDPPSSSAAPAATLAPTPVPATPAPTSPKRP